MINPDLARVVVVDVDEVKVKVAAFAQFGDGGAESGAGFGVEDGRRFVRKNDANELLVVFVHRARVVLRPHVVLAL